MELHSRKHHTLLAMLSSPAEAFLLLSTKVHQGLAQQQLCCWADDCGVLPHAPLKQRHDLAERRTGQSTAG